MPEVREEEELGQTPVLLLQSQACFGHQVDQGVCDLVQDAVDVVLLFQRPQSAGQKCVHPLNVQRKRERNSKRIRSRMCVG